MNKAFKVVLINIAMFSVLMEIGGQLLKKRHEFNLSKLNMFIPWKQAYTDYLAYVNHFRDFNYSKKAEMPYSVTPSNINTDTELLYSCYGENCNNNRKSYELLIQGDSWAEGLDKNIASLINHIPSRINIISAGTTSFSPRNMEAQLGYLRDKGFKFKTILMVIDQTDIGDEYFRYKPKTVPTGSNINPSRVIPFNSIEHTNFYNYSLYPGRFRFGISYMASKVYSKLFGERVPSYSLISSALRGDSQLAVNYFRSRLTSYINHAFSASTLKSIIIITHDHRQHLTGEYTVSTEEIVSDVIASLTAYSAKIKHIHINPRADGLCIKEDCSDYYVEGDISSHPRHSSYPKIINKLFKEASESIMN